MLIYENKIFGDKEKFLLRLNELAVLLKTDPNYLMAVMYAESRLNPQNTNPYTNAAGLIQFMPSTLHGLGLTTAQLLDMTAIEQLNVVYQYLKPYAGKVNTYQDLYFSIFFFG